MFQLTKEEFDNLMFHFGTSSWGGTRKLPYAFTENDVAMLSSVLNSERAIQEDPHPIPLSRGERGIGHHLSWGMVNDEAVVVIFSTSGIMSISL